MKFYRNLKVLSINKKILALTLYSVIQRNIRKNPLKRQGDKLIIYIVANTKLYCKCYELDTPIYKMALSQFEDAADRLNLDHNLRERFRTPERSLFVSIPVRMDDGNVKIFHGYRVQHDSSLGPSKGGVRYHPSVNLGEIAALAMWMTWKCALVGLPDIIANSGGVIVSYFEWVQDLQKYFWKEKEINERLFEVITTAFKKTLQFSILNNVSMRMGALMLGIKKISEAHLSRGLYP